MRSFCWSEKEAVRAGAVIELGHCGDNLCELLRVAESDGQWVGGTVVVPAEFRAAAGVRSRSAPAPLGEQLPKQLVRRHASRGMPDSGPYHFHLEPSLNPDDRCWPGRRVPVTEGVSIDDGKPVWSSSDFSSGSQASVTATNPRDAEPAAHSRTVLLVDCRI